jgi:hypothetical protein
LRDCPFPGESALRARCWNRGGLRAAGDRIDFFEIDPDVETSPGGGSPTWPTRRPGAGLPGGRTAVPGAGRGGNEGYDLLFVDAFSGDGIPTHLLTVEAVEGYRRRLSADGLMVFHLSNRYYDLRPVVKAIAGKTGLKGAVRWRVPSGRGPYG